MDKNRAIVALVIIVFIVVISMLYVMFSSRKGDVTEVAEVQTPEEEYIFDIDNDIDNDTNGEFENLDTEINLASDESSQKEEVVKSELQKINTTPAEKVIITENSPQTGPGSAVAIFAVVLGVISAGIVYKKQFEM